MVKILLTGFEPFGKASLNPTSEIVKRIHAQDVVTAILPVAYNQSADKLNELIDLHQPEILIMLGQAEGRTHITPERIAINLDDARIADNEGVQRSDLEIKPGGALAYQSTLPIREIVSALNEAKIPAAISLSAGAFLCNHIFYIAQERFAGSAIQSGFIHVPLMEEQAPEFPNMPTMPLETMVQAVEIILDLLRKKS